MAAVAGGIYTVTSALYRYAVDRRSNCHTAKKKMVDYHTAVWFNYFIGEMQLNTRKEAGVAQLWLEQFLSLI
jgi:hypothetical protein